jgi:hypothetical protein
MDSVELHARLWKSLLPPLWQRGHVEPARKRRMSQLCRKLAGDDLFKTAVYTLRQELGLGPDDRRSSEADEQVTPMMATLALGKAIQIDYGDIISRLAGHLETALGPLAGLILVPALFIDFDGGEFELFVAFAQVPPDVKAWKGEPTEGFRQFRDAWFRPNHVYIDVTLSSPDDVSYFWPWVEQAQEALGIPASIRGRLPGEPRRKVAFVANGVAFTWPETRNELQLNPNLAGRRSNQYLTYRTMREEERFGRTLTPDERHDLRRRARKNYWRQVIHHPQMRDLKLQLRRTGRPRSQ